MASMKSLGSAGSAALALAASGAAVLVLFSAPAHADEPVAGSSCDSGQLNLTTTSSAGAGLRCLADNARGYIWQDDNGTTQSPADAEHIARDACGRLPHHSNRSDCRSLLDGFTHN